jgi:hypothetical protein
MFGSQHFKDPRHPQTHFSLFNSQSTKQDWQIVAKLLGSIFWP